MKNKKIKKIVEAVNENLVGYLGTRFDEIRKNQIQILDSIKGSANAQSEYKRGYENGQAFELNKLSDKTKSDYENGYKRGRLDMVMEKHCKNNSLPPFENRCVKHRFADGGLTESKHHCADAARYGMQAHFILSDDFNNVLKEISAGAKCVKILSNKPIATNQPAEFVVPKRNAEIISKAIKDFGESQAAKNATDKIMDQAKVNSEMRSSPVPKFLQDFVDDSTKRILSGDPQALVGYTMKEISPRTFEIEFTVVRSEPENKSETPFADAVKNVLDGFSLELPKFEFEKLSDEDIEKAWALMPEMIDKLAEIVDLASKKNDNNEGTKANCHGHN